MAGPNWTFLTNHARVLFSLAAQPDLRLREVAEEIGITERAVQRIVTDLEAAGILTRSREGRRTVGDLLALGQVLGTMAEGER